MPAPPGRKDTAAARLQNVDDAADDAVVVDPRLSPRIGRKMGLKPRKLLSAQPEIALIH